MAAAFGLSREHVNRAIGRLVEQGLLLIRRQYQVLADGRRVMAENIYVVVRNIYHHLAEWRVLQKLRAGWLHKRRKKAAQKKQSPSDKIITAFHDPKFNRAVEPEEMVDGASDDAIVCSVGEVAAGKIWSAVARIASCFRKNRVKKDGSRIKDGEAMPGPDPYYGLDPEFAGNLKSFFAAAPMPLSIMSGYRSPERQTELWNDAVAKYGSPEAARKWVAPPGHSFHNKGEAADLGYGGGLGKGDQSLITWAHDNAGQYGLTFPLANENWHIEPIGARSGRLPPAATGAVADATAPPMPAQAGVGPAPHWMDFLNNQMAGAPQAPAVNDPLKRWMEVQNPFGENPLRAMMFKGLPSVFA